MNHNITTTTTLVSPTNVGTSGPPLPATVPSNLPTVPSNLPTQSQEVLTRIAQTQCQTVTRNGGRSQNYYFRKWRKIKKVVKNTVFLNAAACDEVVRIEEKLAKAKEERRYLLRKLLQYQSVSDVQISTPVVKSELTVTKVTKSPSNSETPSEIAVKVKPKKKIPVPLSDKKKITTTTTKDILDSLQPKAKKCKSQNIKRTIPPIPLDNLGRPVFPMMMGDLTVHSIGEILTEKGNFHSSESIYPVGYVSTRVYANMHNPDSRCLYTCKISDIDRKPVFDIAPDETPEKIIRSHNPDECIAQLIKIINKAKGTELSVSAGSGVDFFGLSHPLVRNLIQSCPGAKKCSGYKWIKFEVNKNESLDNIEHCSSDPVIHFEVLRKVFAQIGASKNPLLEQSSNLRSLLTSKTLAKPANVPQ